jgi:GNAT superfamily N-acetyltransferase
MGPVLFSPVSWLEVADLRMSVLGWATGPVPGDEDPETIHLALHDASGRVQAAVSFTPHECPDRPGSPAVYLWAMVVAHEHQRQGTGRRMLQEVLSRARTGAARVVWADARESAVAFYERCGATAPGESYLDEVTGLPDRRVVFDLD